MTVKQMDMQQWKDHYANIDVERLRTRYDSLYSKMHRVSLSTSETHEFRAVRELIEAKVHAATLD